MALARRRFLCDKGEPLPMLIFLSMPFQHIHFSCYAIDSFPCQYSVPFANKLCPSNVLQVADLQPRAQVSLGAPLPSLSPRKGFKIPFAEIFLNLRSLRISQSSTPTPFFYSLILFVSLILGAAGSWVDSTQCFP